MPKKKLKKISDLLREVDPNCPTCDGEGWVCESHPDNSWNNGDPLCCGGAGAPCKCNPLSKGTGND